MATTPGVEQLTAVNSRVMDNAAPDARFVDQLGALMTARDEGLIGGIGISNVSRAHLMRALEITEIVCVQNFSISRPVTACPCWRNVVHGKSPSFRSAPWAFLEHSATRS
jgi:hypothetical protein